MFDVHEILTDRLPKIDVFEFMLSLLDDGEACEVARAFFEKSGQPLRYYVIGLCDRCWWNTDGLCLKVYIAQRLQCCCDGSCSYYVAIQHRLALARRRLVECCQCGAPVVVERFRDDVVFCRRCWRQLRIEEHKSEEGKLMLELTVKGKKIQVPEEDIWTRDDGVKVIRAQRLELIARDLGEEVPVPELIYALPVNGELYVAFGCRGRNSEGRMISAVGEASPLNLDSEIAKMYPTVMAFLRAKVRWITAALEMTGIYADVEFSDGGMKERNTSTASDIKESSAHGVNGTKTNPGETVVTFGKYKGLTIEEIYDGDPNYIEWLADRYEPKNSSDKTVKEAARRYLDEVA